MSSVRQFIAQKTERVTGSMTLSECHVIEILEDGTQFTTVTSTDLVGTFTGVDFNRGDTLEANGGITAVDVSVGSCLCKQF